MPPAAKLDLYKLHKTEYVALRRPTIIRTKPAHYLSITGEGHPTDQNFGDQIGALYAVAFTIKMKRKFAGLGDYVISKLETQWLDDSALYAKKPNPRHPWHWCLMIRSPEYLTTTDIAAAITTLLEKGKPPAVKNVTLLTLDEGPCVQMLHVGPYEKENETYALMQTHAETAGHRITGHAHEIYLSDPRRVAPEKLKTILRLPIK